MVCRRIQWVLHRTKSETMYTDEDNSTDLIGAFCELLFSRKGHSNGIIVDDVAQNGLFS